MILHAFASSPPFPFCLTADDNDPMRHAEKQAVSSTKLVDCLLLTAYYLLCVCSAFVATFLFRLKLKLQRELNHARRLARLDDALRRGWSYGGAVG